VLHLETPTGAWFATEFDPPPAVLDLPAELRTGQHPGLRMTDHLVRGRRIVGRFAAPHAMVGLKAQAGGRPLRVAVDLRLDAGAVQWWAERADPASVVAAGHRELPRLALVTSQGRPRCGVLLARARIGGRAADVRTTVEFVLGPDEVPDDGMVIVAVDDVTNRLPAWAAGAGCPASPVGLRVDAIRVAYADGDPGDASATADATRTGGHPPRLGLVSAGGLVSDPARGDSGPARTPYVVLNPAPDGTAPHCRLRVVERPRRAVWPPAVTAWTRSLPGRAVGRATRLLDRVTAAPLRRRGLTALPAVRVDRLEVRAVSLTDGAELPVTVAPAGRELSLTVDAAPAGPVLVGVSRTDRRPPGRTLVCQVGAVPDR
jgi:hypothetical protein